MKINLVPYGLLLAALSGCSTISQTQVPLEVVTLPAPDFYEKLVTTQSDVATIVPSVQTVICVSCEHVNRNALGNRNALWIKIGVKEPWRPAEPMSKELIETISAKSFSFDSYKLVGNLEPLQKILQFVRGKADHTITIVGHTDSVGSDAYNMTLGMRRADAVAKWLIANGIAKERITVSSQGEREPIASNATEAGRATNRRAEAKAVVVELVQVK